MKITTVKEKIMLCWKKQHTLSVYKQHDNQNYLVHLTNRTMYQACLFLAI